MIARLGGTPNYVAPEVLADKGYDGAAADTWSIGVILYVFLAGFLPFDEPTMAALFKKIQRADFSYPSWFEDDVKSLLNEIMKVSPSERWTITQIISHPWWKKDGPYASIGDVNDTAGRQVQTAAQDSLNGSMQVKDENMDEESDTDDEMQEQLARLQTTGDGGGKGTQSSGRVKSVNAFEMVNIFSGEALNNLMHDEDEKKNKKVFLYVSPKPVDQILQIIKHKFASMEGYIEQEEYKGGSKLRAKFDLGKGQIHVKVSVKLASEDPILCLVVVRKARGDLLSFQAISKELDTIGEMLQQSAEG